MIAFVRIFATGFLHTLKLFTVTLAVILRSVRELVELPVLHDSSFSSLVCDPLGSDLLRMTVGFPTWISQMEHAHEHVSSNGYWLKNVHHMYHMCRVSPLSGYVRVSSNHQLLRSVNHICHICMVSPPEWIRTCVFKPPVVEKCVSHISHLYGFSLVWMRVCVFKPLFVEKCASQIPHL